MRDRLYAILSKFHFIFKKRYTNNLRVLAYHSVPDEKAFEKQVVYLHSNYTIISIEELLEHTETGKPLPKNPLLITFDDGDVSVLEKGLPVLEKFNLSSCLFIIADLINSNKAVWIQQVETGEIKKGKSYLEARKTVNYFKQISNAERLHRMATYPQVSKRQLTTADLNELRRKGMFIGNHTHTHPMLDKCSPGEIQQELRESKKVFQELKFPGFEIFAYPNGNNSVETIQILQDFQMKLVFLFDHKVNKKKINPLHISRIKVDSDTGITEFKVKVCGAHPFVYNLRKEKAEKYGV